MHWESSVCQRLVTLYQPVLLPPSFRTFPAYLLPQTLQNLPAVIFIKLLAWRNKLLMSCVLTPSKKIADILTKFDVTYLAVFWRGEDRLFHWQDCSFCVATVNPGFLTCYDLERKFWSFALTSKSSWHTQETPLLLLFRDQPRQKLRWIRCIFNSALWLCWRATNKMPLLPVIFETYCTALPWEFCERSPRFWGGGVATWGWTTWTHRIFSRNFPTFQSRKPFKSLCSPRGIFIEVYFEYFLVFWCTFPAFEACLVQSRLSVCVINVSVEQWVYICATHTVA
jgi:hypothetical protein